MANILTPDGILHEVRIANYGEQDWVSEAIGATCGLAQDEDLDWIGYEGTDHVDFELTQHDYEWWAAWADNERLINNTLEERGLVHTCPNFYDETPDWESAQLLYAEYLGITLPGEFPAYE